MPSLLRFSSHQVHTLFSGPDPEVLFRGLGLLHLVGHNESNYKDRSFTYGYVIWVLTWFAPSLTPVLLLQLAASGGSALLLAYGLLRYFDVRPLIVTVSTILCALEPIQLLYERYVMTEALSLLLFALSLVAAMKYLDRPRLMTLLWVQLLGIALVSFRVSFLPFVVINTVVLPLLTVPAGRCRRVSEDRLSNGAGNWKARARPALLVVFVHLAISIGMAVTFHGAYKQLYSGLTGHPTNYNAWEGFFLLATWAPIVEPRDFPTPALRSAVFDQPLFNLKNRHLREEQLFRDDGLCGRIRSLLGTEEGSQVAKRTAINAFKRAPLEVLKLSCRNFMDFFDARLVNARS